MSAARAKAPRPVADPETRPSTVVTAAWLAIVTAIATVVLNGVGVVQVLGQSSSYEAAERQQGLPASSVHSAFVVTVVATAVLALVYAALLVLFARRMRAGHPRSRVVLTVLCAVSLLSIVGFRVDAIAGLLAAFTIVLAWLPVSSDWFRSARRPGIP